MMGGPPLKIEKIFFAFLDELDHFKHKIKSVIMTSEEERENLFTTVHSQKKYEGFFVMRLAASPLVVHNDERLLLNSCQLYVTPRS